MSRKKVLFRKIPIHYHLFVIESTRGCLTTFLCYETILQKVNQISLHIKIKNICNTTLKTCQDNCIENSENLTDSEILKMRFSKVQYAKECVISKLKENLFLTGFMSLFVSLLIQQSMRSPSYVAHFLKDCIPNDEWN